MIQFKLHDNGWTILVEDFNINTATQDDINDIAKLLATNTLIVLRNQSLTVQDEIRIAKMFKNPQQFHVEVEGSFDAECYRGAEVEGSEKYILRVTGEKMNTACLELQVGQMKWYGTATIPTTP